MVRTARPWVVAATIVAVAAGVIGIGPGRTPDQAAASVVAPTTLAVGDDFGCAIDAQEQVLCWGSNSRGQLGVGRDPADLAASPYTARSTGISADSISARGQHACAVREGSVLCWGDGAFGQTGDPQRRNAPSPTVIAGLSDIVQVATAGAFACALDAAGAVWCWGGNGGRQLGQALPLWRATPLRIDGIPSATHLAVGGRSACIVSTDRQVFCWGNGAGPARVGRFASAHQVAVSANTACALTTEGRAVCWGRGMLGQLGGGAFTVSDEVVNVLGLWDARDIRAGTDTFCVTAEADALGLGPGVRCWGVDASGQLGSGRPHVSTMVGVVDSGAFVPGGNNGCWRQLTGKVRCRGLSFGPGWVTIGGLDGSRAPQRAQSPSAVTVSAVSGSSARIRWRAPASPDAVVTGYSVRVATAETEQLIRVVEPQAFVSDLPSGAWVDVSISAVTGVGLSPVARATFRTLRPAPAIRVVGRTRSTVGLAWEGPRSTVRWRDPVGRWRTAPVTISEGVSTASVPVGRPGTPIHVRVQSSGAEPANWLGATRGSVRPTLTILDSEGNPVSGARLGVNGLSAQSAANGAVKLPSLSAGWYSIAVSAELTSGVEIAGAVLTPLGSGRRTLRLPAPPPVRSTSATLTRGGEPLLASLRAGPAQVRSNGFRFTLVSTAGRSGARAQTDAAGRAKLRWFDVTEPFGARAGRVLFVGDSHLYPLLPALNRLAAEAGVTASSHWVLGCPWMPLTMSSVAPGDDGRPCRSLLVEPVLERVRDEQPDLVVLVSRSVVRQDIIVDGVRVAPGQSGWLAAVRSSAEEAVRQLVDLGVEVVIVEPLPEATDDQNTCLRTPRWRECGGARYFLPGTSEWREVIRRLALDSEVTGVSLAPIFCDGNSCPSVINGVPVRRDSNHPTPDFALANQDGIAAAFAAAGVDLAAARLTTPEMRITAGDESWAIDRRPGRMRLEVETLPTNIRGPSARES